MLCGSTTECPFCDVSPDKGFDIVNENPEYVVFKNHSPASAFHLLVIPRKHVGSVKDLDASHIPLVQDMLALGADSLTLLGATSDHRRFGFHIPPFTSVQHLHLHCFGPPFNSTLADLRYTVRSRRDGRKGISWFAEVNQAIATLNRGERVRIF
ncbi:HIT-like protein [Cantharellus anzutake]|uniref:HIT-like protein n=1 Tax=Cantharellus anzutake TaxID=1750568 RepID=UPI0019041BB0|nr:HIT-like protein [Cantharellus anzutake]KAF8340376.1 HIT-like protein [Cantharellus anzutake]